MISCSVILPFYNDGKYLNSWKEVVDYAFENAELEFIFVDDHSHDSDRQLLEQFSTDHERVRVIWNTSNQGPYKTRLNGLRRIQSHYFSFADCDDIIDPKQFDHSFNMLLKNADVNTFAPKKVYQDESSKQAKYQKTSELIEGLRKHPDKEQGYHLWSRVFLTESVLPYFMNTEEHGIKYRIAEDTFIILRLLFADLKWAYYNLSWYTHIKRSDSVTVKNRSEEYFIEQTNSAILDSIELSLAKGTWSGLKSSFAIDLFKSKYSLQLDPRALSIMKRILRKTPFTLSNATALRIMARYYRSRFLKRKA